MDVRYGLLQTGAGVNDAGEQYEGPETDPNLPPAWPPRSRNVVETRLFSSVGLGLRFAGLRLQEGERVGALYS